MKRLLLVTIALCVSLAGQADGSEVTLERILGLANMYLRDSAEIPMDVAVATVVTDQTGKVTKKSQADVHMFFNGCNQQSGKFSLKANSGWFKTGALRDSLSGDLAVFVAGVLLTPEKGKESALEVRQEPGQPIIVRNLPEPCPPFKLMPPGRYLFPAKACGAGRFTLTRKGGDELAFEHYSLDVAGLPARAKVTYLGEVTITAFRVDVDFQEGSLPGDAKPFLWPKQSVTLVTTDRGKISVTNRYSPKPAVKR